MCSRRPSRYWPSDSTRRGWPDEDRRQRNQRPKCELYDGYAFVVLFALTWAGEEPEANEIHTVRVYELIEVAREGLSNALEVHLSHISNTLNQVLKRLTAIATIFMPLTF
jgi:Mg2+ and Co2+ transporter CorA